MNIILLSGGSGKRLWPLSNDTMSKQFLRLLRNDKGEKESMVQRVFRQIKETGIEANIVIATGKSQVESIKSQLGENTDVVIEPERRNTFPAILLASAYLKYKKNIDENETVNAGTGKELTIKELTELVAKLIGYTGEIKWDTTRPNGTPRKLLDVSKATSLGWTYSTELEDGIKLAYEDFLNNPIRAER